MKAHRTDLLSFAFGLVFLALSAWWLLAQLLGLALPPVGWFLAGALILIGILGLVGALRSGRSTSPAATAPAEAPVDPTSGAGLPTTAWGADLPTSGAGLSPTATGLPAWDAAGTAPDTSPTGAGPQPTTETIHPAWLAHSATPATEPTTDLSEGDRPTETLPPVPAEPVRDRSGDEVDGPRREH